MELKKQGAQDIVLNRIDEQTSTGRQPVSYELNDQPRTISIRWPYSAADEQRTCVVDYTIRGAVRRWADVAEFYWKVIEDEHMRISRAYTELLLPQASPNLFKVFIHSAGPPGTLLFDSAWTRAVVDQRQVPSNSFVEVRLLAAPELFPEVRTIPDNRYLTILKQERDNFLQATLRKFLLIPLGLVLVVLIPLIWALSYYLRYGREPRLDYQARYEHEPPRPAPPITVPVILHQTPMKGALYQAEFQGMFATLLDLARRGVVSIQEVRARHKLEYQFILERPGEIGRLDPFARATVEFFFHRVVEPGSALTAARLKDYGQRHAQELKKLLGDFVDQSLAWWREQLGTDFVSATSRRARARFQVFASALIALGTICLGIGLGPLFGPNPTPWIVAAMSGSLFLVLSFLASYPILRWNETALTEHRRWQAFRRFLKDFSALEQAPVGLLTIWEQYYVYATVLEVAKEFLKNVTHLAEQRNMPLVLPAWYGTAGASQSTGTMAGLTQSLSQFASFAQNFSNMVSSFSTAAASGGGFSGGGGGGGGGGSSGAG